MSADRRTYMEHWHAAHPGYMDKWKQLNPEKLQVYLERRRRKHRFHARWGHEEADPPTVPCGNCSRVVLLTTCEHCKEIICGKCWLEHVRKHVGLVEAHYWGNQYEKATKA